MRPSGSNFGGGGERAWLEGPAMGILWGIMAMGCGGVMISLGMGRISMSWGRMGSLGSSLKRLWLMRVSTRGGPNSRTRGWFSWLLGSGALGARISMCVMGPLSCLSPTVTEGAGATSLPGSRRSGGRFTGLERARDLASGVGWMKLPCASGCGGRGRAPRWREAKEMGPSLRSGDMRRRGTRGDMRTMGRKGNGSMR